MADHLSPDKQTLMVLRALRQRVEELEGRGREPIAIERSELPQFGRPRWHVDGVGL